MSALDSVWVEKYKPQKIEDVILPDNFKKMLLNAVEAEKLPHLGFWSSKPGLGKTSTANAIVKSLHADTLWINASLEKGIDVLRDKIFNFASQESILDRPKIVVMDECDNLTPDAQKAFRGFIDQFSNNCSFIFTGNFKSKIIQPLLDRLDNYDYESFSPQEMGKPIFIRLLEICKNENVEITDEVQNGIKAIIKNCYPGIRSMIKSLQRSIKDGKFEFSLENVSYVDIIKTMQEKNYQELVKKVNALPNADSMYEYLYNNITIFRNVPTAILAIAEGQFRSATVRDKNLNLCATLVNLINCF